MDSNGFLIYVGRDFRTFAVDGDELSWFELVGLAKKYRGYNKIESIQYMLPRMSFESGLRKVYSGSEVREMVDIAYEKRLLDLYVVHGVDEPEDPRPDSPLRWQDLIYGDEESDGDESYPDYMVENDSEFEEDGETEDVSMIEDSGDDIHTPASSDEEDIVGARRERRGDLVHADTDFNSFVWKDSRRGTFMVKSVAGEHTCSRNMERNKQLKSTWVASQLLELFKARPHILAKEIHELIRRGFRCVVKKGFVYKGDEMKIAFWKIVRAYNMKDYNKALAELKEKDEAAATAFLSYNLKCFYIAYFTSNVKSDVITNNMAETFNSYIINARTKHLISMMEEVRALLMQRVVTKRQEMQRSRQVICPRVQVILEKNKEIEAYCYVLPST
ncbi:putative surface-exposed virulence protein BigA [Bienertia sinuspersici]